ncbi:argininosuccinate synthase [Candidatus Micrarchaeota archaeon]|nr:argininosuccinate synthase [Candidatus Micrarchaeota archaeon]MBU1166277.1 argininosuccinate synthase [Candidatus Micrarchaeota archaeon]MBU1886730.1 argininosuccinate synthase [Candidatus Micrarchaeota archaeon]
MDNDKKTHKEKVVLAYSGGLDTSVILKWLIEKGYDVIAFIADVGQEEDFEAAKKKALLLGASKVYVEDLKEELVTHYIFQALKGNAIYEGTYLLGTALARPLIAKKQVEIAQKEGAKYVSHGATGKGNDQVRFEFGYFALDPKLQIISPWKNDEFLAQFKGRPDLLKYAEENGIPVKATVAKPYSEDDNLMHISHEAGILEDPSKPAEEHVYSKTKSPLEAPDKPVGLKITFKDGLPVEVENLVDGTKKTKPLELFNYLNQVGAEHGVGRVDMVENRYIGIKSRGIYENPGAEILWKAHRDIEGIAMDKEVMHLRDMFSPKFAELIYNGYWFSPEMDFILSAINKSQELIDGWTRVVLYKGNVMPVARSSPTSLYNQELSSMDIEGGFDQRDSKGFIRINGVRLKAHKAIIDKRGLGSYLSSTDGVK